MLKLSNLVNSLSLIENRRVVNFQEYTSKLTQKPDRNQIIKIPRVRTELVV